MKLVAALLMSALSVPAFAHSSGGGGHSGGGGGHSGAHFSGGGHFSGGSRMGAAPHFNGAAGAHFYAYAAPRGYSYGARPTGYVGGGHVAATTRWSARPAAAVGRTVGRPYGAGYAHPGHWGGGYWGGRFWPGAYYGPGFAWFLPTIPLYCATFWWNSIPYYYYNDAYYTWNPAADGYVATDPPPVAASAPAPQPDAGPDSAAATVDGGEAAAEPIPPGAFAAPDGAGAPVNGGSDHVFAYPTNGQNEAQQASDRTLCDQWAASQSSNPSDYRRAVIACFQGRGYSAQ